MTGRDWQVGDELICVNARLGDFGRPGHYLKPGLNGLTEGRRYTVREICVDRYGIICVRTREIVRAPGPYWGWQEAAFDARRFRRIQPNSKSIEALRQLVLKPDPALSREPVREDVQ